MSTGTSPLPPPPRPSPPPPRPSPSPPPPPPPVPTNDNNDRIILIGVVAIAVGGAVIICCMLVLLVYLLRRSKKDGPRTSRAQVGPPCDAAGMRAWRHADACWSCGTARAMPGASRACTGSGVLGKLDHIVMTRQSQVSGSGVRFRGQGQVFCPGQVFGSGVVVGQRVEWQGPTSWSMSTALKDRGAANACSCGALLYMACAEEPVAGQGIRRCRAAVQTATIAAPTPPINPALLLLHACTYAASPRPITHSCAASLLA